MLSFGEGFDTAWRNRKFRVGHLVELFVPTEILAAAASSEANSNFPASALIDGDRSHLNAGPFDATEFGYGPADNLIGKGLWLGKKTISNPEFIFNNANAWNGLASVTSDYFNTVFNWENPLDGVGSGPVPGGPVFWWRCGDTHRDEYPRPLSSNAFADFLIDAGPNAAHGLWQTGVATVDFETNDHSFNNYLGYPGIIIGDDTSSAHEKRNDISLPSEIWHVKTLIGDSPPWRTLGTTMTFVAWVKDVAVGGNLFMKAGFVKLSGPGFPKGPARPWGLVFNVNPTVGFPSSVSLTPLGAGPGGSALVSTNKTSEGGLQKAFNLNDGNPHMISWSIGKPQGGQATLEIYVDGELQGLRKGIWPPDYALSPPGTPARMGNVPNVGVANFGGQIQEVAWFDYTFMGAEQPDYNPGLVFYNRQKRAYDLGAVGTPVPPAPVPPVFSGTTVVGNQLEVDFVGGTSFAAGVDAAFEGEKVELFDAGWVQVPVGNNPPTSAEAVSQMALAQSTTVPPGQTDKSLKFFNKLTSLVEGYTLGSSTYPTNRIVQASLWEHAIAATPSGKIVFDAMIHQQGVNVANNAGHLMVGLWEGTPTAGKGIKFVMSEATHNFHISVTPPPTGDRIYQTHIFAGDGTNTGVAWAYDTWYRIAIEFDVTPGLVRLFVDNTLIGTIGGLTLTTGVNKLQVWSKGDDRLPPEAFGGVTPAYVTQAGTFGSMLNYIHGLRIGSGCFNTNATYERIVDLGGFPQGNAFFSFVAEALTISDPPSTYTPYWSFQAAYALSVGGPFTTPEDIYLNPGKTSSATDVVFNPQGFPVVKFIAKHNADGGECIDTAGLKSVTLKFGKLAQGLRLQTDGEPVGRLIIYTDPDLGGIKTFQVQRGDSLSNPFITLSGDEILRVQAFEKFNGQVAASWNDIGEITVTDTTSVIIVDFKKNYGSEDQPATNWIGILVLDPGTADDFPRATEIEAYARYDVTDLTESFDVTHQADVNFERLDARVATVVVRNPRKIDETLMWTKEMFQKTTTGQTALDMTAEVVIWQEVGNELKQLAWLGVDDPHIDQETFALTLACRGRHERLLVEKFPSTFKTGLRVQDIIAYTMALSNVAEGFYAMRDNFEIIPVYAPIRSAWDELSDINQAAREPGIFFGPNGVMRNLRPITPAVQLVIDGEGFFHNIKEHVSREQAGKPAALHAVQVEVHGMSTLPGQVVFAELPESAQFAERLIQLSQPVDPLTMFNNWSPLKITRAHPRYPKIAETAPGGIIIGTIKTDVFTTELVTNALAPTDDPNRIVNIKISNIYVTTPTRAREIAQDRLDLTERATNWAEAEMPATPIIELADIYQIIVPTRAMNQIYAVQKVSHIMRATESGATARVQLELTETTV